MPSLQQLLVEKRTLVMGILNVTPDSFSDGGQFFTVDTAIQRAKQMFSEGADIIDIGGESTRPGSETISDEEEIHRVVPVIKSIRKQLGATPLLSIDTYKAQVAAEALAAGANFVNSLGGFLFDKQLAAVIKQYKCSIVLYHIKGKPKTMQKGDIKYSDVVDEIKTFFSGQIMYAKEQGIDKNSILIDPGIGFGKTVEQNLEIIRRFRGLLSLEVPLVIGVSRKSHIGALLQEKLALPQVPSPTERLYGSLAETAFAVCSGARMVRTHDVKETKQFLVVLDTIHR